MGIIQRGCYDGGLYFRAALLIATDVKAQATHLISTQPLSRTTIEQLIDNARSYRQHFSKTHQYRTELSGRIIVNAFFENSTRTRLSFETAAKRLGADVLTFSSSGSSVAKGESLFDTLQTIDAMVPDIIVIRHNASGASEFATTCVGCSIINAGDGKHEHPSQALLDAMTLLDVFPSLEGKTVGIVGDILHSRVARSNIHCLTALGASVVIAAPQTLMPQIPDSWKVGVADSVRELLEQSDAIMTLRLQNERMESGLLPSLGEYSARYGLRSRLFENLRHIPVLHPGPVNYGVEIDYALANSPQSLIRHQVANGVFIRMAMMTHCIQHDNTTNTYA